ncbi:MAG: Mycothiol acetyltransferase [Candidatus Heimdallarchaeota archaeon LC_3]|nr:MAG: Mycothiol acetyltransferase [Candidatus Heimdallarchaeota archaeon LC_3]
MQIISTNFLKTDKDLDPIFKEQEKYGISKLKYPNYQEFFKKVIENELFIIQIMINRELVGYMIGIPLNNLLEINPIKFQSNIDYNLYLTEILLKISNKLTLTKFLMFRFTLDDKLSNMVIEKLENYRFSCLERWFMRIDLKNFNPIIDIDEKFWESNDPYEYGEKVITLVSNSVKGTIDTLFFPEFLTEKGTNSLLQLTGENIDDYNKETSVILTYKNELVGVIITQIYSESGYIADITVNTDFQGKGIGKYLLSKALLNLKSKGCHRVKLHVTKDNKKAVNLYEKLGFTIEKYRWVICKSLKSQNFESLPKLFDNTIGIR